MMPTLVCQRRNSDQVVLAVEILAPITWESRSRNIKLNLKKGDYLIKDSNTPYTISATEFEDTYIVRKII